MIKYPALVELTEAGYWVGFPDFPESTVACGEGEDLIALMCECLENTIKIRNTFGLPIPSPSAESAGNCMVELPVRGYYSSATKAAAVAAGLVLLESSSFVRRR